MFLCAELLDNPPYLYFLALISYNGLVCSCYLDPDIQKIFYQEKCRGLGECPLLCWCSSEFECHLCASFLLPGFVGTGGRPCCRETEFPSLLCCFPTLRITLQRPLGEGFLKWPFFTTPEVWQDFPSIWCTEAVTPGSRSWRLMHPSKSTLVLDWNMSPPHGRLNVWFP